MVYIDDILITGKLDKEHLETLDRELVHLKKLGLKLKKSMCLLMAPSVTYLGHKLTKMVSIPWQSKYKRYKRCQSLRTSLNLKHTLGYWVIIEDSCQILPTWKLLSTIYCCLHTLAMDIPRAKYLWGFQGAFCNTKSASLLWSTTPIGPGLQCITLWLQYCVGSLLPWWLWETSSLCVTYSFGAREELLSNQEGGTGLCLKHFHLYLYCWNFTLASDHNPLLSLFGAKKPVPPQALGQI